MAIYKIILDTGTESTVTADNRLEAIREAQELFGNRVRAVDLQSGTPTTPFAANEQTLAPTVGGIDAIVGNVTGTTTPAGNIPLMAPIGDQERLEQLRQEQLAQEAERLRLQRLEEEQRQEELRREREEQDRLAQEEKIEKDPNVREYLEQTRQVNNPIFDRINRFTGQMTRRLIDQKESPGGTTYRHYQYSYERDGRQIVEDVFMLVDGNEVNSFSPERSETPITEDAYNRNPNIISLNPNDLIVTGTKTGLAVNDIREAYARNTISDSANFPDWFTDTLALSGLQFREDNVGDNDRPYFTYNLRGLDTSPGSDEIDLRTGETLTSEPASPETETPETETTETETPSAGTPLALAGDGPQNVVVGSDRTAGTPLVTIDDVSGEFLDFDVNDALSNFLATSPALGLNLPVDADGNRRNITPDDFPGFPPEILDPNNLFIRVTETTSIDDGDGGLIPATSTRVVPNPAVELLLAQYAERVRALTDLQGSADDILQAQVSASGGLFGGPTGSLNLEQLEDLERETRSIQASGGRLVQERVFDAEGEPTGQFREVLTPLGQQELTQEALRQSGGLLGGFYSPLDASGQPLDPGQQRFVQGFTPQQLLQRQEEEARRGRQQELEILERQRERDLELARINQAPQTFRNIADLYSNPAQLAAIVASGGSPLLRGQLPGSVPLPQTAMQTGAMTPQQASATPFNITNPSGTVFDPNFVPIGGRTIEGDLRRQEANPFNVRDFSGITEDRLNRLTDIELARAQGEAAAQGIAPDQLQDIALGNTPGQAGSPLQGYLAPSTLFR